jgi:NAD(P)-dependent dehydrogenase (short-subunit alcohol dehydrogenase family)
MPAAPARRFGAPGSVMNDGGDARPGGHPGRRDRPGDGGDGDPRDVTGMPGTREKRPGFVGSIPPGRISRPDDIASAALDPVSGEAEVVTGRALPVDGVRRLRPPAPPLSR